MNVNMYVMFICCSLVMSGDPVHTASKAFILSLDVGTSTIRAHVYDGRTVVQGTASRKVIHWSACCSVLALWVRWQVGHLPLEKVPCSWLTITAWCKVRNSVLVIGGMLHWGWKEGAPCNQIWQIWQILSYQKYFYPGLHRISVPAPANPKSGHFSQIQSFI